MKFSEGMGGKKIEGQLFYNGKPFGYTQNAEIKYEKVITMTDAIATAHLYALERLVDRLEADSQMKDHQATEIYRRSLNVIKYQQAEIERLKSEGAAKDET